MTTVDKSGKAEAYQHFLAEIVTMVQNHRVVAVQSVQTISNQLYWNIGELILLKQQEHGWGKSIVEQLSHDLNHHIGEGVSWSPRNLWFMRQLVSEYSNLNQPGSEIETIKKLISEVPWKHNILRSVKLPSHVRNSGNFCMRRTLLRQCYPFGDRRKSGAGRNKC